MKRLKICLEKKNTRKKLVTGVRWYIFIQTIFSLLMFTSIKNIASQAHEAVNKGNLQITQYFIYFCNKSIYTHSYFIIILFNK